MRVTSKWLTAPDDRATGLPRAEASPLERIKEGLPVATWIRYRALKEKRDAGRLTDEEYAELIRLVNEVEIWTPGGSRRWRNWRNGVASPSRNW